MSDPAESSPFEVRLVDSDGTALVVLSGELDLVTAPQLEAVLASVPEDRRIVFDLRALRFMDSSGVGLLVAAAQRKTPAGTRLGCIAGPRQVQRILQITGADRLVEWVAAP